MITTEQKVQVAKDRAADELNDIVGDGYWNLSEESKNDVREIGRLLSLPDDCEATLTQLTSYINGEEEMFFTAP